MSEVIRVPDIGNGEGQVIEIMVKPGDRVETDQSVLTLESDKASMEIPCPKAGVIRSLSVKLGDTLKEGDPILEMDVEGSSADASAEKLGQTSPAAQAQTQPAAPVAAPASPAQAQEIHIPDIGTADKVKVIEVMVKAGDTVESDQSLITLESDKASMEIPAPVGGTVEKVLVKVNDEVGTGDLIVILKTVAGSNAASSPTATSAQPPAAPPSGPASSATASSSQQSQEVKVPDIGTDVGANVIEIMVKAGDTVESNQSLITLESDKASMEIPSPCAGIVESVSMKVGDQARTGDLILVLKTRQQGQPEKPAAPAVTPSAPARQAAKPAPQASAPTATYEPPKTSGGKVHAGPAVRQLAREFGVNLTQVKPTGPKNRILKQDVQAFVKRHLQQSSGAAQDAVGGAGIPQIPPVDFSRFGEVEETPMTRLMQVAATNLHRSWLNVPHVTQFDLADITEVENFRKTQKAAADKAGVKLTLLPILLKACAHLLVELPDFNSSLTPSGNALIRKKYVHIGFAVDTPDGLLVPVIRDVNRKGLLQLAAEAAELAEKARNKKLSALAMQGACFTISSLGHIGGTGFTPIVNAPEVAILGVSKARMQPVWDGSVFAPRLMLPLSLSYDHRVINGATAARFTKRLSEVVADIRTLLL